MSGTAAEEQSLDDQLKEQLLGAERATADAARALAEGDRPAATLHLVNALIFTETADSITEQMKEPKP